METSAKNTQNVERVFVDLASEIVKRGVGCDKGGKGEKGEVKKKEVNQIVEFE
jgi:hypothetical protein